MKILLLDLGTERKEYNEPIGIETLAGFLKKNAPQCEIKLEWVKDDDVIPKVKELDQYEIIGLSLNIKTYDRFKRFYRDLDSIQKKPLILIGNVLASFAYEEILQDFPRVICVRGEGEQALLNVVEAKYLNNLSIDSLNRIPNLAFIDNGNIITTDRCVVNLDLLPPPRRDFANQIKSINGIIRIEGSRGCHWNKCKFCSVKEKYGGVGWRPVPLDNIINDLIELGRMGIRSPYFTDEDFFGQDYIRANLLADRIIQNKEMGLIPAEMNFFISATANDIVNEDGYRALIKLKRAGLREVFVGIESGCKSQLQRFCKKADLDTNAKSITILRELDLEIDIGYILFDPMMSFNDLIINLRYLEELGLDSIDSNPLKALRIQPFTLAKDIYYHVICGSLDIDNLIYPYEFSDSKVAIVYKIFTQWKKDFSGLLYQIQAEIRGEVLNEIERKEKKKKLGMFRNLDFQALKLIIGYVSGNISEIEFQVRYNHIFTCRNDLLAILK